MNKCKVRTKVPSLAYEIVISNMERKLNRIEARCALANFEVKDQDLANDILDIMNNPPRENILEQLTLGKF